MNRSNIPGFTAHASLYRTGVSYAAKAYGLRGTAKSENGVIAQKSLQTERWYAGCRARCLGGYIGSLGGTDLGGCWDDCDFLYSVIEN
jgi:hypothetical protein